MTIIVAKGMTMTKIFTEYDDNDNKQQYHDEEDVADNNNDDTLLVLCAYMSQLAVIILFLAAICGERLQATNHTTSI